jgi:hypothetical protein
MIDYASARAKAQVFIDEMGANSGPERLELQLLDAHTIERPFGWVFFYQARHYVASGNASDRLVGNAPIVVTRGGELHMTGTAYPLDHYLAAFERAEPEARGVGGDPQ